MNITVIVIIAIVFGLPVICGTIYEIFKMYFESKNKNEHS